MIVGAVDIGTNTTRLLLARVEGGRAHRLETRTVVTGLGIGVDSGRALAEEAMARTEAVLAGFRERLERAGAERVGAVATSASRDATNSAAWLDRAGAALGLRPRLISGAEEARLSFRGVRSGLDAPTPILVIDPGGGSTEFVLGGEDPEYVVSVDIGSVRLTERALPDRPASAEQLSAARTVAIGLFAAVELPGRPAAVAGVGGTFTSLAAIDLGLEHYDPERVHGATLHQDALDRLVAELSRLTVAATAAIPSLDPGRAPVLLAGALVAAEALRCSGAASLLVSEADILTGVALSLPG